MALIGFFAVALFGAAMVVVGVFAGSITLAFSGKIEWPPVILFCGGGSALICFAVKHSPLVISWGAI